MRWRFAVAVAAAGVLAAGCSSGGKKADTKTTRSTHAPTSTSAAAPADVAPLTGLAVDPATKGRVALVVKIDNAPKARPQYGLGAADIVVEEGVEGGITRLATIFQSKDAAVVGPVRSARTSDLHVAEPLGRPLFAYSGTNSHFQALIDRAPVIDISPNKLPGAYHRDSRDGRSAPYNLFSSTPALYKGAPADATVAKKLVDIGPDAPPTGTTPVTKLDVHWVDKVRTDVTWNRNGNTWSRIQNGTPTVDGNGLPIAPRNIVTLFVKYEDTGERDQSNSPVPEAKFTGTGEAWIVRDGTLVKGTWTKPSDDAPISLADAHGDKVALLPGQTWIELPSPGNASVA
ncbi:MAG: hypothetical protein QOJ00_2746 [Actinomycetota bacterium]|jgi:hypothetical protein